VPLLFRVGKLAIAIAAYPVHRFISITPPILLVRIAEVYSSIPVVPMFALLPMVTVPEFVN
jgi:hypothetical protein